MQIKFWYSHSTKNNCLAVDGARPVHIPVSNVEELATRVRLRPDVKFLPFEVEGCIGWIANLPDEVKV